MWLSITQGTYPSLVFGFVATATALVIRDHKFNTDEWSLMNVPVDSGRFSEHCNNFHFNNKTCVLTANCGDNRNPSSLNLNKCFWYHKVDKKDNENLGWRVDWNEKNEDRHGITNFCDFCETQLGPMVYTYEENPLILIPMCLPPDDPKDKWRRRAAWHVWLDRYIGLNDGQMECFGRKGA
ncbi:hypothetical protein QBC45DRAFT_425132 [Copromyces sp. CBS 386.78]|nr:hypothetical protein QBC45DRAFT_425132 [Copromyces sp. CBS 386.78]